MKEIKEIKDYLHLYLGCEIEYQEKLIRGEIEKRKGLSFGVDDRFILFYPITKYNKLSESGVTIRKPINECKLILRPLSDMSEEEKLWWFNSIKSAKDKLVSSEWVTDLNGTQCEPHWTLWTDEIKYGIKGYTVGINNSFKAEQFIWLLSKHFDLFGLIEAGIAIDKTTLK